MFKTIRGKVVGSFLGFAVVITLLFCIFFFQTSYRSLKGELLQNASDNIEYFHNNINVMLKRCEMLSDRMYFNRDISRVMTSNYAIQNYERLDADLRKAIGNISVYLQNDIISGYATAILMKGYNHQMIKFGVDADYFDVKELENAEWFWHNWNNSSVKWLPMIDSESSMTTSKNYLPCVRQNISVDSFRAVGWQFIAVSTNVIKDSMESYNFRDGDIVIVYDANKRCVYSTDKRITDEVLGEILQDGSESGSIHFADANWFFVENYSDYSGLTILHMINYKYYHNEILLLFYTTEAILFVAMAVAIMLMFFFSHILIRPIQRIILKMGKISEGDFSVDPELEGDDEIGRLGVEINNLAQNVETLMVRVREEENEKNELEYKILQSQINPHFVYNVLNSIRVMAQLQGADNICKLVENFGGLMKEVSKGVHNRITLQEEIALEDKFIYLHKLRRKGLISVSYHIEEDCENLIILKFLLQPLIENAIVHGFEGKKGMGQLVISAKQVDSSLQISIWDNGVGMTDQEINDLLDGKSQKHDNKYNAIGVTNVQQRIRLLYGEKYGLYYKSQKGEYTEVVVNLPVEVELPKE